MHDDDLEFTDLSRFHSRKEKKRFPLTGIVGQQMMKKGLILVAANPRISSIIMIGENGTGKVSAAEGMRVLLPRIEVSEGCLCNCDPENKMFQCTECAQKKNEKGEKMEIPTPFINLPVGASRERIFGTFEKDGAFAPGIIAQANRGYILIERANLHDIEILKTLLKIREQAMYNCQSGEHNFVHPVQYTIIATVNPADGELDDDIISRFNLLVRTSSIKDVEERIEIVRRVESFKEDPDEFLAKSKRELDGLKEVIKNARRLLKRADIPSKSMNAIIETLKENGIDEPYLRDAMVEAVKANAVINDSTWASIEDVAEVVDMVLGHRIESDD
ncbi:MAG: ATP-binding protein [Thermoplasmata archaeon]|nr:ATP-binding protein [Thermoplasmata archaeon]